MTDTDSIVDYILRTADRNELVARRTRRFALVIAISAFVAGFIARGWVLPL